MTDETNPERPLLDAINARTRARIEAANKLAAERAALAERLAAPEPTERDLQMREVAEPAPAKRSRERAAKAAPPAPAPEAPPLDEFTEAELARRVLSRRKLLPFVERFNPEYDAGWLHKVICEELEQFERDVLAKKSPRLILQVPPRHGKSQLVSVMFPPWFLGRNPQLEVIGASHTTSLSLGFSRKARAIVRSPQFTPVFPDCQLVADEQSAESWRTTQGGGYSAVGVGSAVVGKGCSVLIIDDPVSGADDAESAGAREAIKEWYQTEAYTRLAPGGGVLIIMQRWHDDDLAGWLQARAKKGEGEEFRVVHFPAIAEDDEPYRRKGEPLHPTRYGIELLENIRRNMTPRQWEALYQQNPVPDEGSYFTSEMFRFYLPEDLPDVDTLRTYCAWDLAITQGERNDYTCGIAAGLSRSDDLYVLDRQHGRWDAMEIVERFLDQVKRHKVQVAGMEKGHIQMTLGPYLNKRIAERRQYGFVLEPLQVGRRDKEARARSIQGRMQQGKVYLPKNAPWVADFMRELLRFPSGEHDDQVDALAHLGLMLDTMVPTQAPREKPQKSWRDRIAGLHRSDHKSAMSA